MIFMADSPISGSQARISFGWEAVAFKTASASINKAFGQGTRLTTFDVDNSVEYVYGLGSQDARASVVKEFKGTWGVEFLLSDPWWIKGILGGSPAKTGGGPYTYTWNAIVGISSMPTALTIDASFDLGTTDSHQQMLGCVVNSMNMTCNVGEVVRVRLEGPFATLGKNTSLASLVSPVEEPFSFASGTLQLPNATTIADVQSVELNFNRNQEFVWGLGSRYANAYVAKQREWNIKVVATYEVDSAMWDSLLGSSTAPTAAPAEVASAELTITNSGAGAAERSYTILFQDVRVEKGTISPVSVEEVVKQDITLRARSLSSIICVNNTSAEL
jgi:hypothetical protein